MARGNCDVSKTGHPRRDIIILQRPQQATRAAPRNAPNVFKQLQKTSPPGALSRVKNPDLQANRRRRTGRNLEAAHPEERTTCDTPQNPLHMQAKQKEHAEKQKNQSKTRKNSRKTAKTCKKTAAKGQQISHNARS